MDRSLKTGLPVKIADVLAEYHLSPEKLSA
jgi:hypothetical protein